MLFQLQKGIFGFQYLGWFEAIHHHLLSAATHRSVQPITRSVKTCYPWNGDDSCYQVQFITWKSLCMIPKICNLLYLWSRLATDLSIRCLVLKVHTLVTLFTSSFHACIEEHYTMLWILAVYLNYVCSIRLGGERHHRIRRAQ
jgi:hypothetical protein